MPERKEPHPNPWWSLAIVVPLIVFLSLAWGLLNGLVSMRTFGMGLVVLAGVLGIVLVVGKSASLALALDGLSAPKERWPAARARIQLVAENLLPRLLALLPNRDAGVAYRVLEVLGEHGDPQATPKVVAMLKSDVESTRRAAYWALAQLRDRRAAGALMGGLEREEETLRPSVTEALRKLSGRTFGEERAPWRAWWAEVGERYPYQISGHEPPGFDYPRPLHV